MVRKALLENGFAMIRSWLATPRSEVWLSSQHRCWLDFLRETDEIVMRRRD